MRIALSLGSNKGDREKELLRAIRELLRRKVLFNIICSTFFKSPALLLPGSPPEWDREFINCAIIADTSLSLRDVFKEIKLIEKFIGRKKKEAWAPREIDIDILLYEDIVIDYVTLKVPHIEMLKRDFVLLPLAEVASQWRYPGPGKYNNVTISNIVKDKYGV